MIVRRIESLCFFDEKVQISLQLPIVPLCQAAKRLRGFYPFPPEVLTHDVLPLPAGFALQSPLVNLVWVEITYKIKIELNYQINFV